MKLLLDEMWPSDLAVQLRLRGHDVVAVLEHPDLQKEQDSAIFAAAQVEQRSILTKNVADFRQIATVEIELGRTHYGLILTSNRRNPRHDPRTPGRIVTALDKLLGSKE